MSKNHDVTKLIAMPEEKFSVCLETLAKKLVSNSEYNQEFMKDPKKALEDLGISLKEGVEVKIVESEEEAKKLPPNVLPFIKRKRESKILPQELQKVAGGIDGSMDLPPDSIGIPSCLGNFSGLSLPQRIR